MMTPLARIVAFALVHWKWLAVGFGTIALLAAVNLQGRHAQARHDKPIISGLRTDLTAEKAETVRLAGKLAESEAGRKAEFHNAKIASGEAEDACSARIAAAHRSAGRIRAIVEKPVQVDPKGCPARAITMGPELKSAIQP